MQVQNIPFIDWYILSKCWNWTQVSEHRQKGTGVKHLEKDIHVLLYPPQSKATYHLMLETHCPTLRWNKAPALLFMFLLKVPTPQTNMRLQIMCLAQWCTQQLGTSKLSLLIPASLHEQNTFFFLPPPLPYHHPPHWPWNEWLILHRPSHWNAF